MSRQFVLIVITVFDDSVDKKKIAEFEINHLQQIVNVSFPTATQLFGITGLVWLQSSVEPVEQYSTCN